MTPVKELEKPAKAKPDVLEYDVSVDQRFEFHTERTVGGIARRFKVAHIFPPKAISMESILEFERRKVQTIDDASSDEIDVAGAMAIDTKTLAAIRHLYESSGARFENYVNRPSVQDIVFAVNNMLLGLEFVPVPTAADDEPCPDEDEGSTYPARCLFDGYMIDVSATLRAASDEEHEKYNALINRTILIQGQRFGQREQRTPSQAKPLVELFDAMKTGVTGYKDGKVPIHHRIAYVRRHLQGAQKLLQGN